MLIIHQHNCLPHFGIRQTHPAGCARFGRDDHLARILTRQIFVTHRKKRGEPVGPQTLNLERHLSSSLLTQTLSASRRVRPTRILRLRSTRPPPWPRRTGSQQTLTPPNAVSGRMPYACHTDARRLRAGCQTPVLAVYSTDAIARASTGTVALFSPAILIRLSDTM